jgi:carbamoyltransferase
MFLLQQLTHRMIIKYHPEIGHLYVPNLKARVPHETGGYYVRTNSLGFRSDFEFSNTRNGRPRILFLGDSYTAGDGCDNEERFSELLGQELNAEVYNYGLSGSGTDQQLLVFERFAKKVNADLIVWCVTVENIERIKVASRPSVDRVSGRRFLVPKPYFILEGDELRLKNSPVPLERPTSKCVANEVSQASNGSHWINSSIEWYRTAPWLNNVREFIQPRFLKIRGEALRHMGFQPHPDYLSAGSEGWRLMRAILTRLIAGVGSVPVLIVPVPTYFFYLYKVKPLYQSLFDSMAAPKKNVHVLNVTSPLTEMPWKMRRQLCFEHDTHFSPVGHRAIAHLLKEEIQKRGLLPAPIKIRPAIQQNSSSEKKPTFVLGISCFYHNSAAALIKDGQIIAAAEEERFSRVKNDRRFPSSAANYCLEEAGIHQGELSAVVYYDNASLTFERILHTLIASGSKGEDLWVRAMPSWLRHKLDLPGLIRRALCYDGPVLHDFHHRSHAASAFYPSPFKSAVILTIDGVGEWATASISLGKGNHLHILKEMRFPHSLGLLYSAFTQFTGFEVNEGEYKMMGLAPYGEPKYVDTILKHLVDLKEDGSVELNLDYFAFLAEPRMTNERFDELFGGPPRKRDSWITQRERDLARSIQVVTEEAVLRMGRYAHALTGEKNLCMAGGVALNCVANGRLLREGPFADVWIQPAAGDAGGALGAALDAYYNYFHGAGDSDGASKRPSVQGGSFWGPEFSDQEIRAFLETHAYPYRELSPSNRAETVASLLQEGKIVGHLSGSMEFGPRSLGARSILGDARNQDMQVNLNLKIKYRESFRPFAPTVLAEKVTEYFELDRESPYMLFVAQVKQSRCKPAQRVNDKDDLLSVVRQERSDIPAVTHVDYSARVQTIRREDHPAYYDIVRMFEQKTGCAVLINTSFNVNGEPIVCTPNDAYRCFMHTEMDALILGNSLLIKTEQPQLTEPKRQIAEYEDSSQQTIDSRLIKALRRIYAKEFLPIASSLRDQGKVQVSAAFGEMPSMWKDFTADQSPRAIFPVGSATYAASLDSEKLAESIMRFWTPGPAATALRPVLVKLIKLGHEFPTECALEEEVPESIYVMF